VRFVGGCVRDSLLGRPVSDIDIATTLAPETVMARLADTDVKTVPTGLSHGTVTAVSDGVPYEVTTLRIDRETDGRHAVVVFTDDWVADAARRDFTINALSLSVDGTLYDPFGGEADLMAGRVRFVGDATQRIREDYLRLLRLFRFHAYFGRDEIDAEALAAAQDLAPGLARISAERIRGELFRLLEASDPLPAVRAMSDVGVLARILPETASAARLSAFLKAERRLRLTPDPVVRLAALVGNLAETGPVLARRLRLANADRDRLVLYGRLAYAFRGELKEEDLSLLRALQHEGPDVAAAALVLAWSGGERCPTRARQDQLLRRVRQWERKKFPLTGNDLLALGVGPGPEVGRLLRLVEDWWLGEGRVPDREACLRELARIRT
jgi:poly(A) polymerase